MLANSRCAVREKQLVCKGLGGSGREAAYPSAGVFYPHGVLLAICRELACHGGLDGAGRDVSQAGAEAESSALVCGDESWVDFIAREDEGPFRVHWHVGELRICDMFVGPRGR